MYRHCEPDSCGRSNLPEQEEHNQMIFCLCEQIASARGTGLAMTTLNFEDYLK
jgi:hypothetical protein